MTEELAKLSQTLTRKAKFQRFSMWLIGDTPLITHAWSEKARREMLSKQVKAPRSGRDQRDPQADFVNSLYDMGNGTYGFPATGVKKCILSVAHKDKGVPRTEVRAALWIDADMVRTRPALAGAVCDMPMLRIYGDDPVMREDMVRVGKGLNKTASLAYRGQFTVWAIKVRGRFNPSVLPVETIAFLTDDAGLAAGLGEWRNEKDGMFGAFHRSTAEEEDQWEAFAADKGPIPVPQSYRNAAE